VAAQAVDVLIVSLGSTQGLRVADEELRDSIRRAGASVNLVSASPPPARRTLMLTDLAWARAARRAARLAPAQRAGAVIYSSTTAALLWPRAGAIRFDALGAGNRPGRHGLWQRPLERRRLAAASLLLPWSELALAEARRGADLSDRVQVLPVPVEPSGAAMAEPDTRQRDIAAITYAANPAKKGLARVLAAWRELQAERGSATGELVVAGASAVELAREGLVADGEPGIHLAGALDRNEYRALLRRSRVFVCAPRREDHGIAQLEALADGCQLVSTPSAGPYVALRLARELDPRLVDDNVARGLRAALDQPLPDYAERARAALAPFARAAVDRIVAERLLPRLLGERA
jgi:glycosyltransferase involved in cell wall biosynthesis